MIKKQGLWHKLLALLAVILCIGMLMPNAFATTDEWDAVKDTFTEEAVQGFIPDPGFAKAVYDDISFAIENNQYHIDKANICDLAGYSELWPMPLTVEEILAENLAGSDLVLALLENYVGPIGAQRKKITDISGYAYLKNATSIDLQYNLITDLSGFTNCVVAGSYNFNSNPICIWPATFPNTIRAATHGVPTAFTVTTAPLAYRFGEVVTPTLTYNVYYPNKDTLNTAWYSKTWSNTTAYGDVTPPFPQADGSTSIKLPPFSLEGSAVLEIGLTGVKEIEDYTNWQANTSNAIHYVSGMSINETGGTHGQGNSPAYRFGVQTQRYATVNTVETTNVTGGFKFTKTDAGTGSPVPGAEYTLYKEDGTVCVGGAFTTDENGVIKQGGLAPGKYYLKETKAPSGYTINTAPVWIEIADIGVAKTVTGGVASFQHDVTEPNVEAVWGNKTATTGVWNKTTTTKKETPETLNADAILTNKSNDGFKTLTALTVQPESDADNYNVENVIIVVKMAGNNYATYTSDADALAGINAIINSKKLTGDITIDYSCTFAQDESVYLEVGQTEQPQTPGNPGTPTDPGTPGTPAIPGTPSIPIIPISSVAPSNSSAPNTGDSSDLMLWLAILVLSVFGLWVCGLYYTYARIEKKRNTDR